MMIRSKSKQVHRLQIKMIRYNKNSNSKNIINNDYHCEYSFKFLQKNKYDLKTSSVVSENYYNNIYYNFSFFKNDMIVVSTTSVIVQKSITTFREKVTFQKLIE